MGKKLFLLFSHQLTDEQWEDAQKSLDMEEVVYLPPTLLALWRQVPPDMESIGGYAQQVYEWLEQNAQRGDYVLIQGEMGLVFQAVNRCYKMGLIPVYATTKREVRSFVEQDGRVHMNRTFKHERFRKYQL